MMYGYYLADENRLNDEGVQGSKVLSALKRVKRMGSDMIDFIPAGARETEYLTWLDLDTIAPAYAG